jgi:hypothetical protein
MFAAAVASDGRRYGLVTNLARSLPPVVADAVRSWEARLPAAKRRFKEIFPGGFADPTYLEWVRDYKWSGHQACQRELDRSTWAAPLAEGAHAEIARRIASFYARSKSICWRFTNGWRCAKH